MERPSQNAANFVRELAELTYRLAAKDIVVSSLYADWSHFGSWVLHTQKGVDAVRYGEGLLSSDPMRAVGPEEVRFCWDGRDKYLSVDAASPTRIFSAPNDWKNECNKGFDKPGDEVLRFVEDYITKRFED
jgi:hypothetical protein